MLYKEKALVSTEKTEAKFLDVIRTKALRVFILAIHSYFY